MPPSPSSGCIITPECAAAPPASAMIGCEKRSKITSSPGRVCRRIAIWLHIVPLGRNSAASWPNNEATRSCRAFTVGSSPRCSSATSADAIARRIPSLGRVWVSDRRFTTLTPAAYEAAGARARCLRSGYALRPNPYEVRLVAVEVRPAAVVFHALRAHHLFDGWQEPLLAEAVMRLERVPHVDDAEL